MGGRIITTTEECQVGEVVFVTFCFDALKYGLHNEKKKVSLFGSPYKLFIGENFKGTVAVQPKRCTESSFQWNVSSTKGIKVGNHNRQRVNSQCFISTAR